MKTNLCFLILILIAFPLQAQPSEFGYYASAMNGVGRGNYIIELARNSTFVHIREPDSQTLIQKLALAKMNGLKVMVDIQLVIFPWHSSRLHDDWQARLKLLLGALESEKMAVMAFYLLDEPYWNNAQPG